MTAGKEMSKVQSTHPPTSPCSVPHILTLPTEVKSRTGNLNFFLWYLRYFASNSVGRERFELCITIILRCTETVPLGQKKSQSSIANTQHEKALALVHVLMFPTVFLKKTCFDFEDQREFLSTHPRESLQMAKDWHLGFTFSKRPMLSTDFQ